MIRKHCLGLENGFLREVKASVKFHVTSKLNVLQKAKVNWILGQLIERKAKTLERVQSWAANHSLGFEDEDLGSSPGWWAPTVATYCPSRPWELHKVLSSKPCE